jgi:hypothetical protein
MTLWLENAATFTWVGHGVFSSTSGAGVTGCYVSAGRKVLSQELNSVRITLTNGTDTFDAGEMNIAYL